MGRIGVLLAALLLAGVGTACEESDHPNGIVFNEPELKGLAGFWTGTEEITGGTAADDPDASEGEGVRFRVALRLTKKGTFHFWSVNYPVAGETRKRTCAGVYEKEGRVLEFFPNAVCRPLPLSRYVIGRAFPEVLILTAGTTTRDREEGSIRVRLRLERD